MPKLLIDASLSELERGLDFVEATLEKFRIRGNLQMEAMLISEEAMVRLIHHADPGAKLQISIRRWYGTAAISLSASGREIQDTEWQPDMDMAEDVGHDSEEAIRSLLLHAYADKVAFSRKGDHNFVKIRAGARERVFAMRTTAAFLGAILLSLVLLPLISEAGAASFAAKVLVPFQSMFLNALQMVTAPAMFFSIMTATARFSSFSDPGKVTLKIFAIYLFTSVAAVFLGIALFRCFRPSEELIRMCSQLSREDAIFRIQSNSLLSILEDIIPNNFVDPFLHTNAGQLVLIAVLSGVVLGRAGHYSKLLQEIAGAMNQFFSGLVELISNIIPFATFMITLLMVLYSGLNSVAFSLQILLLVLGGFSAVLLLYLLVLGTVGRLNPVTFLRKYASHMLRTFWGGSSVSAIADNMQCCEKKFGVSPKVYNFSIPIGAIANLDGTCLYMTIAGLLLARLCGSEIRGGSLLTILLTVIILSMGAPITPGSVLLSLTLLLNEMNASLIILSLVLGINSIIEMLLAACNTAGDMICTLLVAKSEKLLNTEIYNQKCSPRDGMNSAESPR